MNEEKVYAIIIDDDVKRIKEIKALLPEFIISKVVKHSEAKACLRNGIDGQKVMLVIMDADEKSGNAMSLFKYISEDPDRLRLFEVATVLLTNDEFSDHSFEYYDYGEPTFYSGEIDDNDFYLAIVDALDEAELRDEPIYEVIEDEEDISEEIDEQTIDKELKEVTEPNAIDKSNVYNVHKIKDASKVATLLEEEPEEDPSKPKLLIVDYDENTYKAMKMFLTNYNVAMVDSNIKAIDYILKNRVDVVAIEYNMQGIPGFSILKSIRNQPGGRNIKAFMIMGEKRSDFEMNHVRTATGVAGVITKPIVKKQLYETFNKAANKVD